MTHPHTHHLLFFCHFLHVWWKRKLTLKSLFEVRQDFSATLSLQKTSLLWLTCLRGEVKNNSYMCLPSDFLLVLLSLDVLHGILRHTWGYLWSSSKRSLPCLSWSLQLLEKIWNILCLLLAESQLCRFFFFFFMQVLLESGDASLLDEQESYSN